MTQTRGGSQQKPVAVNELWRSPTESPALCGNEVHVWRIDLDVPDERARALACLLSADEHEVAGQCEPGRNWRRFVVAHGALRSVLAGYKGTDPDQLRLDRHSTGKPYIAGDFGSSSVSFNLSHSADLALCAVSMGRSVGVDVERARRVTAMEEIADRYFSRREAVAWRMLPGEERAMGFLAIWTRKEACGKALGRGVSGEWAHFSVPTGIRAGGAVQDLAGYDGSRIQLWVHSLDVGPAYMAAVAGEGSGWDLRCWQWC